ncbi:MAG: hypothetical protein HQ500_04170 [Flavobacteriales bacterium]|nr:hypothetical protein [Flavobacteriales bacterium]
MHPKLKTAFVLTLAGLVFLAWATAPDHPKVNSESIEAGVLESDELYFKNLRKAYYQVELREDAGFEMLRHKDRWRASDGMASGPFFTIVSNPRFDEAYVMLEWEDEPLRDSLFIEVQNGVEKIKFTFEVGGVAAHASIAASLFENFYDQELKFYAVYQGKREEIWKTEWQRKVLRTALKDYFRLVGTI